MCVRGRRAFGSARGRRKKSAPNMSAASPSVDFVARYFSDALAIDEDEFADAAARCVAPLRRTLGGSVTRVRRFARFVPANRRSAKANTFA